MPNISIPEEEQSEELREILSDLGERINSLTRLVSSDGAERWIARGASSNPRMNGKGKTAEEAARTLLEKYKKARNG